MSFGRNSGTLKSDPDNLAEYEKNLNRQFNNLKKNIEQNEKLENMRSKKGNKPIYSPPKTKNVGNVD
jgi:hypothetical protein